MMFLKNYPAMKIGKYLVIADLHLGITKDIYDSGVTTPRQSKTLAERLNKLKKLTRTRNLVLLGDVKHKVLGFSINEKFELERFFETLQFEEIIIIKGNHDGNIENMIPEQVKDKIKIKKSIVLEDYFLTHGHRNISTSKKIIVIGHNQPAVKFRDKMKAVYYVPVWVRGAMKDDMKGKELIMMPAFNDLCGHTVVNRDKLLGPIAKKLDRRKSRVYMLDGTDIGTLTGLKKQE